MHKWKLREHSSATQGTYSLVEKYMFEKPILNHITADEIDKINIIVDEHNEQVDRLEKNELIISTKQKLEKILEELEPHFKQNTRAGSPNDAIVNSIHSLRGLIRELQ